MNLAVKIIFNKMNDLVMFRGTKEDICSKLNSIGLRDDCFLEPMEDQLPGHDLGFNTNLGMVKDTYLDYEVYMLPTNKDNEFIITEIKPF